MSGALGTLDHSSLALQGKKAADGSATHQNYLGLFRFLFLFHLFSSQESEFKPQVILTQSDLGIDGIMVKSKSPGITDLVQKSDPHLLAERLWASY